MSVSYGPDSIKKTQITVVNKKPFVDDYETIERKGVGHPDTIADALAAKISLEYSKYTLNHCDDLILHHQVDKVMVIGGKTEVSFGKGRFIEPIKIIVAGRASNSYQGKKIPVDDIVKSAVKGYFGILFPMLKFSKDYIVLNNLTSYAGPGTIASSKGAIANMFTPKNNREVRGYERLVANDTSYCIAYSPYSKLEFAVLEIEKFLNSRNTKQKYPWLGSDIKIMAFRNQNIVSITSCIPQIAKYVKSLDAYKQNLDQIGKTIYKKFSYYLPKYKVSISLNTKDDYEKMNVYLTVTGSSLSGDIGVTGRGNRSNGIITSNRPMSMEGTNGKNPRYYSGFVYAVLTKNLSNEIFKKTGKENVVEIVSQNGGLLSEPWKVRIITKADKNTVLNVVENGLKNINFITDDFIKGKLVNY
jgi:S-adenosylmethionine synthetase